MKIKNKILITGGTGLVGSHLIKNLLQSGLSLKILIRESSNIDAIQQILSSDNKNTDAYLNNIEWIQGDINDVCSLSKAFLDVSKVYHCAAIVSFNKKDKLQLKKVNIEGTANIVNMCLEYNVEKLCYVSSIAAIGRSKNTEIINENTPWNNEKGKSLYALSKYDAELEVWRGIAEGLNAVIINPSIILGPGNWHKGSSKLFDSIWNGLNFYTSGSTGFVDVRDVVIIMQKLMESDISNERFIVSSENVSYKEVLFTIADSLGVKRPAHSAGKLLSGLAWRVEYLKSILTQKQPLITKETANTSQNKYFYDNCKVIKTLNYEFIGINKSIIDTAQLFKIDKEKI